MSGPTAHDGFQPVVTEERSGPAPAPHAVVVWLVWLVATVAAVLGLVFGLAERAARADGSQSSILTYLTTTIVAIVYASVGLALYRRGAQATIGWLFLIFGAAAGLSNGTWSYVSLQSARGFPPVAVDAREVAWLASTLLAPVWLIDAIALLALFPDGRLVSHRWRPLLALALVGAVLLATCLAVLPGPLTFYAFSTNPHAAGGALATVATALTPVILMAMLALVAAAAWSLRVRYARSEPMERLQLRWFAWACSLVVAGAAAEILGGAYLVNTTSSDVVWLVFMSTAITVPIAALVAIMRYRLYDIDRLIGQTFVLGALTAILAGIYAASIRLFTAMFVGITGQSSDIALVLTTLVLATSFTPVKQRLEAIANERLSRPSPPVAAAPATSPDFDERVEAIARRVAREVAREVLDEHGSEAGYHPRASARSSVDQSD